MLNRREFLAAGTGIAASALHSASGAAVKDNDATPLVDCHTHFYDPTRPEGIPWPGKDDRVLYRTVLPRHFLEQAASLGVTKTVVVEASPRVEDNAWLLQLAADNPSILGVVGNLAPGKPKFGEHLQRFAGNKAFRGIRIGHDALRAGLEHPDFLADIRRLSEFGLELDVNGGPEMPADAARLAERMPALTIVINHLANVDIDGGPPPKGWLTNMQSAAKHRHVFCKVSALVEHARPKSEEKKVPRDVQFYRPVLDAIWNTFGDDRLIYGSNWPVTDLFSPYGVVFSIVREYIEGHRKSALEKFFWKNAEVAYCWPT
jgi:predicted TIM-barrel fold metal-dependent hydrolase